jgi:hypothetical protein
MVGFRSPPAPANASRLFIPMSFSHYTSGQERKLQDLEMELATRTKDVKARLAQLNVQVRELNGG